MKATTRPHGYCDTGHCRQSVASGGHRRDGVTLQRLVLCAFLLIASLALAGGRVDAQTEVAAAAGTSLGTSTSAAVSQPVPAGHTLVVQLTTSAAAGAVSVCDGGSCPGTSKNTYTAVSAAAGGDVASTTDAIRQAVLFATNVSALVIGDPIIVTHPSVAFRAVKVFDIGPTGSLHLSEGRCTGASTNMSSSASGQVAPVADVAIGLFLIKDGTACSATPQSGCFTPTNSWAQVGSIQFETGCGTNCRSAAAETITPTGAALRSTANWVSSVNWCSTMLTFNPPAVPPTSARVCFPQFTGVPFTYKPPAVDTLGTFVNASTGFAGDIDRDTGWTHGFRYVLSNGTSAADGAVQAIQDSSSAIYLGFQIKGDMSFDPEDSIVVGFDPDGTGPNMQRLIVHPVGSGATDPNGNVVSANVSYWKGYDATQPPASRWGTATHPTTVTTVAHSGSASWDVEVKIDKLLLNLPAATDFRMYVNLVRVNSIGGTDTQFTWPPVTPLRPAIQGNETLLEGDSLPLTTRWGTASLATSCSGVNISYSDITSNHNGVISLNDPNGNQFSVVLHNSGTPANGVKAWFQIANYGLPAPDEFVIPGAAFNNNSINLPTPTDPAGPITVPGGGGTATLSTGFWKIGTNVVSGVTEHDYYQAHPDMCIRVALDSGVPNTVFSVQSSWNNFSVGTTSEFVHDAVVGTKGYKLNRGQQQHEFDLTVTRDMTPACRDRALIARYPDLRYAQLDYVVHGCRHTGEYLVINGKKFENCESVGAFGYQLRHDGSVKEFKDELTGKGLERAGHDGYRLSIAPGKDAVLRTRVVSAGGEGGSERGLCGQFIRPGVGAMLFFGIVVVGFAAYRPRNKHD